MAKDKTTATTTTAGTAGIKLTGPKDYPLHHYADFERVVAERVRELTGQLYLTNADPEQLWNAYLAPMPEQYRQHYTCNCCRRFIQHYGCLVKINPETGEKTSALWHDLDGKVIPPFFEGSVQAMSVVVLKAKVVSPFFYAPHEYAWGTRSNPSATEPGVTWTHLHGIPDLVKLPPYRDALLTVEQFMASKREEHHMLCRSLVDYPLSVVNDGLSILNHGDTYRSEKGLAVLQWFAALHQRLLKAKKVNRDNLIWAAATLAPPGFCHLRSGVVGTLLDDLVAGLSADKVMKRWAQKLDPIQYRRKTEEVSDGVVKQAEEIFAKLNLGPALERRWATSADVLQWIWRPQLVTGNEEVAANKAGGLFDHLKPSAKGERKEPLSLPPENISWEKFKEKVLPSAAKVEYFNSPSNGSYYGLLTAVHPTAPPILQWDGLERIDDRDAGFPGMLPLARNPVSHYFYYKGSLAPHWKLEYNTWTLVKGVMDHPCKWQRPEQFKHMGEMVLFALEGAKDVNPEPSAPGLGLFPEILRKELHGVRSVLEAHSNSRQPVGRDAEDQVNGLGLQKDRLIPTNNLTFFGRAVNPSYMFRVTDLDGRVRTWNIWTWE